MSPEPTLRDRFFYFCRCDEEQLVKRVRRMLRPGRRLWRDALGIARTELTQAEFDTVKAEVFAAAFPHRREAMEDIVLAGVLASEERNDPRYGALWNDWYQRWTAAGTPVDASGGFDFSAYSSYLVQLARPRRWELERAQQSLPTELPSASAWTASLQRRWLSSEDI